MLTGSDRESLAPGIRRVIVTLGWALMLAVVVASVVAYLVVGSDNERSEPLQAAVDAVASESRAVTERFLEVAQAGGGVVARSSTSSLGAGPSPELRALLESIVAEHPDVDGAFVGWPDGAFLYATRSLAVEADGYRIKQVEPNPVRVVTEWQVDNRFRQIDQRTLLDDEYDPRARPWYQGALESPEGWTETYEFASSGESGITHFRAVNDDAGGVAAVVGIDMRLTRIEAFLTERAPGEDGIAAMVSPEQQVISGTNMPTAEMVEFAKSDASATGVAQLDSETRRVSVVQPLDGGWSLMVSATERDFGSGFIGQAQRVRGVLPFFGLVLAGLIAWVTWMAANRVSRLQRRANVDSVTGLPNRASFRRRVWRRLYTPAGPDTFVLALVEVSRSAVDTSTDENTASLRSCVQTLESVAERYPDGSVGRYGDREFGLFIGDVDDQKVDGDLANLSRQNPHIEQLGYVQSTRSEIANIGIDELFGQAERALRQARLDNRELVRFDASIDEQVNAERRRRRELRGAIERGEFCVHFQPEVDLATGAVIGAEALLRWQHVSGSSLAASEFIEDLERFELLGSLSEMIVAQTAALASTIGDHDFGYRVNFAADQLGDATFDMLRAAALKTKGNWCIEITERTMIRLDEGTLEGLRSLVRSGIDVALDDFGTGYSSLSELERLPLTVLKLDRSFVANLEQERSRRVIELIAQIATTFELDLVAEGIERQEHASMLHSLGYQRAQGWLYGRALPRADFVWSLTSST